MAELIVALDVNSRAEAEAKVRLLGDAVNFYKIGLELFTAEGPDVVKAVKAFGKKVSFGNGYYQTESGKKAPKIPLAAAENPQP